MVKITVLYGHPKNLAAFERYYGEVHMPLAAKIPGVRRIELSKVTGTLDGTPPAYYRMGGLYFDNGAHIQEVMKTPEAQTALADLANFATGGMTVLVSALH